MCETESTQYKVDSFDLIPVPFSECCNQPAVWKLLDAFEHIIPWKKLFTTNPTYHEIFTFISKQFRNNPSINENSLYIRAYKLLKAQIKFNTEFDRVNQIKYEPRRF